MPNYTMRREDPPASRRPVHQPTPRPDRIDRSGRSELYQNLLALTERPDTWERIAAYDTYGTAAQIASQYRRGKKKHPPGVWEFKHGEIDEGGYGVWAKYIGPGTTNDG